jgi:hypothetical protein
VQYVHAKSTIYAARGFVTPAAACWMWVGAVAEGMRKISYAGYRFPPEVIHQAIWLYLRFTLSFRDVEDLLAERGIAVSYETVRRWVNQFGPMIAVHLRKRRPTPSRQPRAELRGFEPLTSAVRGTRGLDGAAASVLEDLSVESAPDPA